jgi:hypothetical protein
MPRIRTGFVQEKVKKDKNGKIIKKYLVARFQFTDATGKRRERNKIVVTKTDGKNWLKQQDTKFEHEAKSYGDKGKTFLAFTKDIEPDLRNRRSVETMLFQLKPLREYLGKMKLPDINYQTLEGYREWRRGTPIQFKNSSRKRSDATIAKEFGLLSKIFTKAKEKKLLTVSPFAMGGMLVSGKSKERDAKLTLGEEKRLLEACKTTDKYGHNRRFQKILQKSSENGGF